MTAKRLIRSASERLLYRGTPIVYIHIPKSGGTAVNFALGKHVGLPTRLLQPVPSYSAAFAAGQMLGDVPSEAITLRDDTSHHAFLLAYHLHAGWRYVGAHLPVNATLLDGFAESHHFMTVVREPVERWISHYLYNKTLSFDTDVLPTPNWHGSVEDEFADVIDSPYGRLYGTVSTTMLSGTKPSSPEHANALAADAIANLRRFRAVGVSDRLDIFGQQVSDLVGRKVEIGHANATAPMFSERKDQFAELQEFFTRHDVREQIAVLSASDNMVYTAAQSIAERFILDDPTAPTP